MDRQSVSAAISNWPKDPRESAERLLDYYGLPHECTDSRLVWHETKDGWKRTILTREEVPHDFPAHHTDYLEQFIDYKVPISLYSSLADFDGSLIVERTKGEMSARCGGTTMNFVAINLANDIVTGKRSVLEARQEYVQLYEGYQKGDKHPYTQAFQFERQSNEQTRDPDKAEQYATAGRAT